LKKTFVLLFLLGCATVFAQKFTDINSKVAPFSRMGYGARGIGMGNSMSAVTEGNLVSYYNPASSVFQVGNSLQTGYSFLSLDRRLNFLNFTKCFQLGSKSDTVSEDAKYKQSAGISFGLIQSGTSNIDGRNSEGIHTEDLTVNEYQFFGSVSKRFSKKFAMGLSVKVYYSKLYDKMTSTGVGLDLGAIYKYNDDLAFSFMLADLNSKYKWDSSQLYGEDGISTENILPVMKKIGVSYNIRSIKLLTTAELEISNAESKVFRFGCEYNIYENLYLRGGIDQIDLQNSDRYPMPALGFSYTGMVGNIPIGVDYAFQVENYSSSSRHIVGLNIKF